MSKIPCNCFHSKADHAVQTERGVWAYRWCKYSEYGQCPCDHYTEMDNLEYVEFEADKRNTHD